MRKSLVVTCVLCGLFLSGCDYLAARAIDLVAETSYQPEETNVSLRHDFNAVTEVVSAYALSQGFEELVSERKPLQRVYQKSPGDRAFRLEATAHPQDNVIAVVVVEMMQTRKPSEVFHRMYTELRDKLRAEFGERIVVDERE